ncbi:MAG TPA: hypothetical protein VK898_22010 [Chloroflexota bacterium]|nr:hypothetical protein [Chloroflexota bacterium]
MKRTALVGVLLALIALAIVGFEVADRAEASVEGSVRRYAAAVTNSDLDAAMAEIAPDQRERWTDWVRGQLGNVYDVRGIAVRSPSILERVAQRMPGGPREVTTVMDVDRAYPDEFYQPSTRVPVEQFEGRWYLAAPFLAEP